MSAIKAYEAMVEEAARVGLPKFYDADLFYHDRTEVLAMKSPRFLWALRECGTHLIDLHTHNSHVAGSIMQAVGNAIHWYIYDSGKLRHISHDDAYRLAWTSRLNSDKE